MQPLSVFDQIQKTILPFFNPSPSLQSKESNLINTIVLRFFKKKGFIEVDFAKKKHHFKEV